MSDESNQNAHISLTSEIVSAYVSNNPVPAGELPDLIASVYASLSKLDQAEAPMPELTPAVPIKKSVTRDWIVCLEDGKRFKSLKRHLSTSFDMTPDQYRAKWGLQGCLIPCFEVGGLRSFRVPFKARQRFAQRECEIPKASPTALRV